MTQSVMPDEGAVSADDISYKNGKAAAGENAPAAVPPATMPVVRSPA